MNPNEALWLPNGSVRAILALLLVLTCAALLVCRIPVPDWLVAITSSAVTYYFAANQHKDLEGSAANLSAPKQTTISNPPQEIVP